MSDKAIEGIVSVMLTPFYEDGSINYEDLGQLTEWYLANGVDVLFAACQSSEILFMNLEERVGLSRFVVDAARGRVPVVASGHVSETREEQLEELLAVAETGPDALILIVNRLDPKNEGEAAFRSNLNWLLDRLPADMPLGLYECPAPYHRLLSDSELDYCARTGRFVVLKDVCCDLEKVRRRVKLVADTPLAIINANGTIAWEAIQAGSKGYSGVFTNFHPDLYAWLYHSGPKHPELANELSAYLVTAAVSELMGYPALAKLFLMKLGVLHSMKCRAIDYDIRERFWWGGEPVLDKMMVADEMFRRRIASTT